MYGRKRGLNPTSNLTKFVSLKMGTTYTLPSLCHDLCFLLEFSDDITAYSYKPDVFNYWVDGEEKSYTPDFKVTSAKKSTQYLTVSTFDKAKSNSFRSFFPVVRDAVKELGGDLVLITEKSIRVNPLLENLKLVRRYSSLNISQSIQSSVMDAINKRQPVSVAELIDITGFRQHIVFPFILSCLANGSLNANIVDSVLSLNTKVWRQL